MDPTKIAEKLIKECCNLWESDICNYVSTWNIAIGDLFNQLDSLALNISINEEVPKEVEKMLPLLKELSTYPGDNIMDKFLIQLASELKPYLNRLLKLEKKVVSKTIKKEI